MSSASDCRPRVSVNQTESSVEPDYLARENRLRLDERVDVIQESVDGSLGFAVPVTETSTERRP